VNLQYQIGGTTSLSQTTVTLSTTGNQQVAFTASAANQPTPAGGTWVTVSPTNGEVTSSGTPLTIGYNTAANLAAGTWTGTVTVSTPLGAPTTTTIPVSLNRSPLLPPAHRRKPTP
jgi:hypothetical protein